MPVRGKRNHLWDDTLKGFGVMVTATGARSYIVQYRIGGRGCPSQTITIGRHSSPWTADKAREHAADLLELVRRGIDPKKVRADEQVRQEVDRLLQQELAFGAYADLFIKRHARGRNLRSADDIEAVFRRDLTPHFGSKSINSVTRSDVARLLEAIGDRSGSAANKAHKWLKKMFNFAVDRGDLSSSPMDRMAPPHNEQSRDRALKESEIKLVWEACNGLGYPFGPFAKLLLLTGQRLREVAGMRWTELNEDFREWRIPGARTKNAKEHLLPLSEPAREILRDLKALGTAGPFVFSTTGRSPISGFSKAKARIDALVAAETSGIVPPWTFHDLRRTVATGCQQLGVPIDHTEALLNHTGRRAGLVSVYQVYAYRDEKAAAIELWGGKVVSLL